MTPHRTAITLPVLLIALAGCGKDGGNDSTPTTGSPSGTAGGTTTGGTAADCVEEGGACVLEGRYTESMRLTADKPWLLRGKVEIGDDGSDVTLTIEPGTTIYGESASNAFLVITRGANIIAQGTASDPITFTSDQAEGSRSRGDWGGLAINGYGLINVCAAGVSPCEAEGEGGTGTYGGTDNADNSGILEYVIIQFGGTEISTDNEINGLGLQGVGSGTVIDHLQIHKNLDDGVEFWGGAVNVKHLVVTGAGDDGIDWDLGWVGKIQYALVEQAPDAGNNGNECDNNPDDHLAAPVGNPTFSNVTFLGEPGIAESNFGMLFRRGAAPQYTNIAVGGFSTGCLAIRDQATIDNFTSGLASLDHVVMACAADFEDADEAPIFNAGTGNSSVADLGLGNDWVPDGGSPLLSGGQAPADPFFDAATFIGAIGTDDWTAGWTTNVED